MSGGVNLHATAVVIGVSGILLVGPSGSGKSRLALSLLAEADALGLFARLIADDQVFIAHSGGRVIASAPPAIAGKIEIYGSGIAVVEHLDAAVMDFCVRPVDVKTAERLPEPELSFTLPGGEMLPLVPLMLQGAGSLARLNALCPGLADGRPARPCIDGNG
ncbi:HPr kinase/phosphorylase [Martelella alba]|uniref:HPr kinase/phosphorylase n=1 Tax=Martelella alba TaxID=2590451 RepID=A0A506UEY9_9HYPH|nr:HPr kinase/phosphorylase [Martelella alba]TPW32590.1 HPr kinase/phosphorylase [Martelella alba]